MFAHPENHVEMMLVIRFLLRPKFHAKQFFVLSSSMKLGPGLNRRLRLQLWLDCTLCLSFNTDRRADLHVAVAEITGSDTTYESCIMLSSSILVP